MTPRRDYYEILGVPRDADANAIKHAFRELALRYHPDRSHEPDAEERFKEIAEAYAVLGNDEKRAQYDAHGFAGVSGLDRDDVFAGLDLDDLFGGLGFDLGRGGLFDHFFGRQRRGPPQGAHVEVEVEVPLSTVVTGGEHRIAVEHPRRCETCRGSGAKPGTSPRSCATCGGSGQQISTREEGNVPEIGPAEAVLGTTLEIPTLDGHARLAVPPGSQPGTVLRLRGKGLPAFGGGAVGDLYVPLRLRIPNRVSAEERKLWEQLRALGSAGPGRDDARKA